MLQTSLSTNWQKLPRLLMNAVMGLDVYRTVRGKQHIARWQRAGRLGPPPQLLKAYTIRSYAHRLGPRTFIETGTYQGDTSWDLRDVFDRIYTVELHPALAALARRRFRNMHHIHVLEGDSAAVLPNIIGELSAPILFWLDGHYSGTGTARGEADTPVLNELACILARPQPRDVVLIDDARAFKGWAGYPLLEQVREMVIKARPSWSVQVHDDIVRIHEAVRV